MKAIVQDEYGPPEVLALREIDRPSVGPDDVLVRVCAAGVDRGVWHLMTGLPYLVRLAGYGVLAPKVRVRGQDVAGVVEAVGGNVARFRPGDEVFGTCEGAWAEYARAPQERLVHKPDKLSFEQAAAVPTSAMTALQALRDAGELAGKRALIIGASGGVGTFAVQMAKAFRAEVTGVCSTSKMELVHRIGADRVIDYTKTNFTESTEPWDVILDAAGNRPLWQLRRVLTDTGVLVIIGGEGGGRWLGGTDRQLRAALISPFVRQSLRSLFSEPRQADLELVAELIEEGKLTPVVDTAYPLADAPQAIRRLSEGRALGKVVVAV